MTREEIRAQLGDVSALVCTLYGEAANEPIEGLVAVASAIRNRVYADLGGDHRPDWWGEGFTQVCLKRLQFSCWWEMNANSDRVYRLAEGLIRREPKVGGGLVDELQWIARGIVEDQIRDRVSGSTHYITEALYRSAPPAWARGRQVTVRVGAHVFFAGVEK